MREQLLSIHTSNRLESLVEHLARTLGAAPLPPLEREMIVVQSQGMARWILLELARRWGLSASLEMPFPTTFCDRLADRILPASGRDSMLHPPQRPRNPEILVWRIYDLLGRLPRPAAEPGPALPLFDGIGADPLDPLRGTPADYLEDDPDQRKRHQLALRLARTFQTYQLYRPDLLAAWESSQPSSSGPEAWQARLWRSLAASEPDLPGRRILSLQRLLCQATTPPEGLPRRLTIFGISTLPPPFLDLLTLLSRFLEVRIYFTSPTYHYWGDLRSERELARLEDRRKSPGPLEESHFETGHPLLGGLGQQGRDFFNLLQSADPEGNAWHELDFTEPQGPGVLATLQRDILHLTDRSALPPADRPVLDPDDRSLRVHICHSPRREMEVLRDQILDAFAADPTLRLDDVLVLVPSIDLYAPYIEAVFGAAANPSLRYSIADRQVSREQPSVEAVMGLLGLIGERLTPDRVFDLLDLPAIRRAFRLPAQEIPRLRRLVERANIRWGIDGRQRSYDFDLPTFDANTWRAGLDRLIMGHATGEVEGLVSGIAPLASATAGDAELLGNLARFAETLFSHLRRLRYPRPLADWAHDLDTALSTLFAAQGEAEERALQLVRDTLAALVEAGKVQEEPEAIPVEVFRDHLAARFSDEGFGGSFLAGRITFCALKPMRTIPFRLLAVAGLDDTSFPRREAPGSFDLIQLEPRPGDRSSRADDRYLFLEILLAARQRLILSYVGRSQQDGSPRAPSVVLGELLDALESTFRSPDTNSVREHLQIEHRLHSFHPAYFDGREPGLFSFSAESLAAARALAGKRHVHRPFISLEPEDVVADESSEDRTLDLDDLIEFWVHPSRYFGRRILQIHLDTWQDPASNAEPFLVDPLSNYRILQWMVERRLDHPESPIDPESELAELRARGELPLAGLGLAAHAALRSRADRFVAQLPAKRSSPPRSFTLSQKGWHLRGQLDRGTDDGLLRFRCARIKPKDQVRAWIAHLAWNGWNQDQGIAGKQRRTLLVGEGQKLWLKPQKNPGGLLDDLIAGWELGRQTPLPFFENASHDYVGQRRKLADPMSQGTRPALEVARDAWLGRTAWGRDARSNGDRDDPWTALCFRHREPLDDEAFTHWARCLWEPLLDAIEEAGE